MNAPARITVTVDRHGQPIVFGAHDTPRARANGCSVVEYVRVPPDAGGYVKAAMDAGCDEAERLGYGSQLGYVEAASISAKAATVALAPALDVLTRLANPTHRPRTEEAALVQSEVVAIAQAALDAIVGH
jgi:hypothetical protein